MKIENVLFGCEKVERKFGNKFTVTWQVTDGIRLRDNDIEFSAWMACDSKFKHFTIVLFQEDGRKSLSKYFDTLKLINYVGAVNEVENHISGRIDFDIIGKDKTEVKIVDFEVPKFFHTNRTDVLLPILDAFIGNRFVDEFYRMLWANIGV